MGSHRTPTGDYEAYEAVGAPDGGDRELVPAPVPAQRLWRWLPGVDLIVDTAANNVRFGGVHGLDRGNDSWVQLPEEVEALVPLFAKTLALSRLFDLSTSTRATWSHGHVP